MSAKNIDLPIFLVVPPLILKQGGRKPSNLIIMTTKLDIESIATTTLKVWLGWPTTPPKKRLGKFV
jgi:hypothetical protein